MTTQIPPNSVWSAMTYTPPRGRCNFKTSLMSPACPCLRFMLHPVKAATSFECDGCNHHASFHSLENAAEDAILRKWEAEEMAHEDGRREAKRLRPGVSEDVRRKAITSATAAKRKRPRKADDEDEDGVRFIEIASDGDAGPEGGAQGMLQRTMALFGTTNADGGAEEELEPQPARRPRRGKKGA